MERNTMIFGAYLPETEGENAWYKEYVRRIKKLIGYEPIICFRADTTKHMVVEGTLLDHMEFNRFILFDSEKFDKLDMVRCPSISQSSMEDLNLGLNAEVPDKYCMFLVKSIDEVGFEVNYKDVLSGKYTFSDFVKSIGCGDDPDFGDAKMCYDMFLGSATNMINEIRETFEVDPENKKEVISIEKNVFHTIMLPYLHSIVVDIDDPRIVSTSIFWDAIVNSGKIKRHLKTGMLCEYYDMYDEFYERLALSVWKIQWKNCSDPDEKCPCNSGKLFKDCHGKYFCKD